MKKRILGLALSFILVFEVVVPAWATTISGVRNQRSQTQQSLNEVNGEISDIQTKRDAVNSELQTMNDQLVELLTSIEILEEEISLKQKEIDKAKKDLTEAQDTEAQQYESMKKRIQFMYEQGNMVYMQALIGAVNYSDMVNKAEYVEGIYNYDRKLLAEFVETREGIENIKAGLEQEQDQMRTSEYELEKEKESLEMLVALKKRTVEDFDEQLAKAQQKASAYKTQLKQQTERIRKLEEKERKKKEEEEKKKREEQEESEGQGDDEDGDGTTSIDVSTGDVEGDDDDDYEEEEDIDTDTSLGQQVCDYACQFVGNPYVYGGTSLTEGADCSGFTQAVYAHFGISIPRDSYSQRSCGYGVSYRKHSRET